MRLSRHLRSLFSKLRGFFIAPVDKTRWYVNYREKGAVCNFGGWILAEGVIERDGWAKYFKEGGLRVEYKEFL